MNNNFHYSLRNKEILRRVISKGLQSNNNPPQSQDGSSFDFDLEGLNLNNPDFAPLDTIPIPKSLETKPINPSIIETPLSDSILNTTNSKYNTKGLNSEDLGKLSTSISKDLDNSANAKNNSTLDNTVKTVGNAAGTALGVPGLGEVIGLINTTQDAVIEPVRKVFANKEASNLASGNLNKYRYNRVGRKFTESYQKYNTLGGIGMGIALGATVKEAIDPDLSDFYNYQDAKKKRNESLGILNNKGEMLANPMYSTAQRGGSMETGKPSYIPVSSQGLLQYPNQPVIVPTNNGNITMKYNNLPNKVLAINAETNQPLQVMEKGKDYRFRYNNGKPIRRILEVPIAQKGEEVEITKGNETKTYNTDSPEYKELYNTGRLLSYSKNSDTYSATPLKQIEVKDKAPEWAKYKREYEESNPKYNYINQYLTPLAISLGNTKTNYPERLDIEYEEKALDYAGEQLVKNKPQGKLSREEWLNKLTAKEEELIKRNPKYQTNLWSDTKRGIQALMETNPAETISNILNSNSFTNREKQDLLKDYAEHPAMTKFGDITKILSPLTVGSKVVQSAYRDDTTFEGALKGEKNKAGIVEDILTDVTTYTGLGLAKQLGKVNKVVDATKVGSNMLNKTDDVIKNLPKLEQIPLDFNLEDVLKNISSTERKNMEIVKKGNAYFKELNNSESLKRLKEFGDEYSIDLLDAYKKAEKRWDYGNNIGKNDRFQVAGEEVFKDDIESALGVSTFDNEGMMKGFLSKDKFADKSLENHSINYVNKKASIEDYDTIVWHELSHDINKNIISQSPKLQNDLSNIFVKSIDEVDKTKIEAAYKSQKFDTYEKGLVKSKKESMSVEDIAKDELAYVSKPTETWAFLSTNLRQDLKNTGVIKNYNEILTPEKLEQAIKNGNTVFSRFEPYIKDKDAFIKLFNKMTLSIAPAVVYLQNQNKTEQ